MHVVATWPHNYVQGKEFEKSLILIPMHSIEQELTVNNKGIR